MHQLIYLLYFMILLYSVALYYYLVYTGHWKVKLLRLQPETETLTHKYNNLYQANGKLAKSSRVNNSLLTYTVRALDADD